MRRNVEQLYKSVGSSIEKGNLKTAIEEVFEFIRSINKYFDEKKPWITVNSNNDECSDSIYNCLFSIINIANLLNPFLPSSSHKVKTWLGCDVNNSRSVDLKVNIVIGEFEILFQRLDKKLID
ncbi:class I tRNA ligase family protein [Clostridium sp. FP1]|nr:class I tRNA ligase family protein [Clostridium sp. FP1]